MGAAHRIVIAGAGGIGRAAGLLLAEWGDLDPQIAIGDVLAERAAEAADWIRRGATREARVEAFAMPPEGSDERLEAVLREGRVLLDCLPWHQAVRMARLARKHGLHYANLTEHVESSDAIAELARGAERGFVIQTGLAPGFVNVFGHKLFLDFCRTHGVERVESLKIRVGALPVRALPPHYYGFTWSTFGVATEYLEESVVIRGGRRARRPSLTEIAALHLGDIELEEALTSGGAADLPQALEGRVEELDYKTLRHPGHWSWVKERIAEVPEGSDPIPGLEQILVRSIPKVEVDQVVIFAAVEGYDRAGERRREDELLVVPPRRVGRHTLKAIQCTTAA
ncbi:MAG TPA: saccharopine dehydrogenase NADP-binding domain-containing protein, partial [Thermoanaerobaculia bacterium]|nr:saccharopine dehydrogenase NADP-binding domain-containing protein [Thermoanaerobaculia bacterium]